ENPTTQYEAVEEFKKALELAPDSPRERLNYGLALLKAGKTAEGIAELQKVQKQAPDLPHSWFNLGIAYKKDSQYDKALPQLEKMAALVPDEPVTRYNLGVLYKLAGKPEESLRQLEAAAKLGPRLAGPRFQLYNAYRQAGRAEDAARELAVFRELKKEQEGAAVPEDLEWSWYSEIYDEPAAPAAAAPAAAPIFETSFPARGLDPASAGLATLDFDADGKVDLLAWSAAGAKLLGSKGEISPSGLEGLQGPLWLAPGDFDNDGRPDLAVIDRTGAALYQNAGQNAGGIFRRAAVDLPKGDFRRAVWLDFDHDYDVDLLLLGKDARLVRNALNGGATWSDETARFPFVKGQALAAAVFHLVSDTQGQDLVVTYADRPAVIYRDRLGGLYQAADLPALPAGTRNVAAADLDQDGWMDLVAAEPAGAISVLRNERRPQGALAAPAPTGLSGSFVVADLLNRGVQEPIQLDLPGIAADVNADGRTDLVSITSEGGLRRQLNRTETKNRWLAVRLEGVKNLKLAPGTEVEVKAGSLYQKQSYAGVPLVFGLGTQEQVDTVRITWPNGLIQNEAKPAANRTLAVTEAPRLSGSCPMIFTWNGERFEFITDVLGVAPLGASSGDGEYFPVDHDEDVRIPGEALVEKDGRYEVRITEELREVAYLDQIRLTAIDHPAATEILTNEKFQGPPFPEFRLFGVERKIHPARAVDGGGRDVLDRLLKLDRAYPDGYQRDSAGVAELHSLTLDFGKAAPDNRALLVLAGWVDWADGSTFLGAAQAPGGGLIMPSLQVKDASGNWRTVIEDMGIPAGKPKTIVVDLTGKFLSESREVRIVTNLCVYWDEIYLSENPDAPEVRVTAAPTASAALRFRGFSRPVIHPERKQPESFDYQSWMPVSMWNPTPGLYTRYGDVRPLLDGVDDRLVVMGSGDEIRLSFDAAALPPLPPGWRRDFLLRVDGWAKDADANTAFSQTVEPLPFHGMSRYPYPSGERFPDDPEHRLYREHYNTRPALRILRDLRAPAPPPNLGGPRP
ncbi:MAG TPA: FG-GAP-like repeat-containing protein, partial [Thermoanaerobaculia bacterium]|nr:FG-GAP-like repeat-containing protein [Thermoanaerobaculia bacterium]